MSSSSPASSSLPQKSKEEEEEESTFMTPREASLAAAVAASSGGLIPKPKMEFHREYRADSILATRSRHRSDYTIDVAAKPEECKALARRFELARLDKLEATLRMYQPPNKRLLDRYNIGVEGRIRATVSQVCVRSLDVFTVQLDFPIDAVVRPIESIWDKHEMLNDEAQPKKRTKIGGAKISSRKNHMKKRKRNRINSLKVQEMSVDEIEDFFLNEASLGDEWDPDTKNDGIIEDELIYSKNGMFNVGELIAQLFWLNLDPYPERKDNATDEISLSP